MATQRRHMQVGQTANTDVHNKHTGLERHMLAGMPAADVRIC